ncbi:hypothetical protein [Salinisphaera sp.]|uniref:hypothetical protein n=1 Tax=Salinisphaera sp. TaxID=1914330 RepID=UPI003C79A0BD
MSDQFHWMGDDRAERAYPSDQNTARTTPQTQHLSVRHALAHVSCIHVVRN